ncbi:MAG: hydrogenase 2 operon protein HybA [bacterium]
MSLSRRSVLKAVAAASASSLATKASPTDARAAVAEAPPSAVGMLYDATRCIGCKACMGACNAANDVTPDTRASGGVWHAPLDLNEHAKNIIKLYRDPASGEQSYVKRQCMHCLDPACATACMLGAYQKRERGIVSYDPSLCIGCRYCEMACPFNVPKFEWSKAAPKMVKCELCKERVAEGKEPACCEVCPVDAVIFGLRSELLAEAHKRIEEHPDRYLHHVYGEHEAGGTQVLYLSHVPFEKLGLPAYDDRPVPETVRTVQHSIYRGFVAPVALYASLVGVLLRNRRANAGVAGVATRDDDEEEST